MIAHSTEQQCGFGFALPPEESHITPDLGTTGVEEIIVVFNHNVINLCFTADKSTMYTSYYDKVYEL